MSKNKLSETPKKADDEKSNEELLKLINSQSKQGSDVSIASAIVTATALKVNLMSSEEKSDKLVQNKLNQWFANPGFAVNTVLENLKNYSYEDNPNLNFMFGIFFLLGICKKLGSFDQSQRRS